MIHKPPVLRPLYRSTCVSRLKQADLYNGHETVVVVLKIKYDNTNLSKLPKENRTKLQETYEKLRAILPSQHLLR